MHQSQSSSLINQQKLHHSPRNIYLIPNTTETHTQMIHIVDRRAYLSSEYPTVETKEGTVHKEIGYVNVEQFNRPIFSSSR